MTKRPNRKPKPEPKGVNEPPLDARPAAAIATPAPSRQLHVNGNLVPEFMSHLIAYDITDEGVAEKNAKRVDSKGRPHSGVKVLLAEGFDQAIRKRAREGTEPWETADPLLDAVDAVREPGFVYRGLGPAVIKKRGMRGWEAVIDKKGDVATAGSLVIGKMPIERAEKRNKRYRDEGNALAAEAAGRFKTDHERTAFDGAGQGIRILRDGETLTDSNDPDHSISIGVRSQRGNQRADVAA